MIEDSALGMIGSCRFATAVLRALTDVLALAEIPAGLIVSEVGLATTNETLRARLAEDVELRPLLTRSGHRLGGDATEPPQDPWQGGASVVRDEWVETDARAYRILEFAFPQVPEYHLLICRLPRGTLAAPRFVRVRFGLTAQEARVAIELSQGLSNRVIARKLGVSERTVRHHVEQVMRKLDADSRTGAAAMIWRACAR